MPHSFRRSSLLAALVLLAAFVPLARPAFAASIVVTSFADSGAGTLRAAITSANSVAGADTITFSGPGTIVLTTPLPALTGGSITIDGTFPAGGTVPKVEIQGGGTIGGSGIVIHSSNNTVRGLILNGFVRESFGPDYGGAGITVSGSATSNVATGNVIEYNYIGTNSSGSAIGHAQGSNNTEAGVLLIAGASTTNIHHNVISGNKGPGVYLTLDHDATDTASAKNGNVIHDNLLGLNAAGTAALPNTYGIWVGVNSQNTVVGPGNTISGNGQGTPGSQPLGYGVFVQYDGTISLATGSFFATGTVVKGNKIGTNPAGTAALPNKDGGVLVGLSTNTTIGGTSATDVNERNLISGNFNINSFGVAIEDYPLDNTQRTIGAVVQNNWIGLDATGAATLPNRIAGVLLREHTNGARVGPGNVISGNGSSATGVPTPGGIGVQVSVTSTEVTNGHQAKGNEISNNLIGSNAAGTAGFTNQSYGISLKGDTSANVIKNNRISFNQVIGVNIEPNGANAPHGNTVQDNQIGTNVSGGTVGNGTIGVQVLGASNIIGPGNVIAGHTSSGIAIASSQNTVKGNTIRNNQVGITISGAATGSLIGGSTASDGNSVTNNTADGISVTGAGTINNKISHTTTNANGGKGIALTNSGNAPIAAASLSVVVPTAPSLILTGNATGCTGGCTIEIFTDDSPLDNEGPIFLPIPSPLTGINGGFSADITGCKHYLIFTLTDVNGNTSEFLSPTAFIPQCVPLAPIVSLSTSTPASPQSALPGTTKTFQHTVTNTGTAPGSLTVTAVSSLGWPTVLSACPATLAIGASCTFTVMVTVPAGAAANTSNDTLVTASLAGALVSQSQTDRVTTLLNAGLTLTPPTQTKSTGPGQPVSYVHTLTNTGNGPDSFAVQVSLDPSMAGWTSSVTPAGPISLAPNATTPVTVTYTPAAGIASPPSYTATVRLTSTTVPSVFKEVTDITSITTAAVAQISSTFIPPSAAVDPGSSVDVAYKITNVGNITGTFILTFTKQAGWTATPPTLTLVSIEKGTSKTITITLQVPANALAGDYPIALTATATSAPKAQTTKADRVTVNQKAGLLLTPAFFDTPDRAPNTIITYTEQLTNTGNFADAITLAATTNTAGWTVRLFPTTITLNPGATTPIQVEVTIPLGQVAGVQNVTSITATSSQPAITANSAITTTIASISDAIFQPTPQQKIGDAGHPVTFTFTLINSGSIPQSYTLAAAGVPSGWSSTLTASVPTLAPGASQVITLILTAPAGTADGTPATVTITATCDVQACPAAKTAIAQVTIGPPFSVGIGGVCDGPALPGALITCVHTVTNVGFSTDTYIISAISQLGWLTSVGPAIVTLAPGSSSLVTITLSVPTSADAGLIHDLSVIVHSTAAPSIAPVLHDLTKVLQVAGVSFSPSLTAPPSAGQEVEFQHTVLNTGNGIDAYTITATQDFDWDITIVPTQTNILQRGIYQTVVVTVQVPPGSDAALVNHITLQATSQFTSTVSDQLVDTIGVLAATERHIIRLPLIQR